MDIQDRISKRLGAIYRLWFLDNQASHRVSHNFEASTFYGNSEALACSALVQESYRGGGVVVASGVMNYDYWFELCRDHEYGLWEISIWLIGMRHPP